MRKKTEYTLVKVNPILSNSCLFTNKSDFLVASIFKPPFCCIPVVSVVSRQSKVQV